MPRRRTWTRPIISVAVAFGLVLAAAPASNVQADDARAVERLRAYLQIDSTSPPAEPPGGEGEAARLLAGWLLEAGLEPRLLESPGGRISVYARVRADAPGADRTSPDEASPALVLTHHIDVVPAGAGWTVAPFSGRLLDGRIWGRGAVDVKSLGVAQLEAVTALLESGAPRAKDLIFLGVADEEQGGGEGTGWLLEEHPELFAGAEGVLNEGGSNRVAGDRVIWWGVEVVQKRPLWLRLRADGRGGHASMSQPGSAGHRLLRALGRLLERPPRYRMSDAARVQLAAQAELVGDEALVADYEAAFARGETPSLLQPSRDAYQDSLQVTQVELADAINVVAATATASLDLRLLPDTDADRVLADLREILGPGIDIEIVLSAPPADPSPRSGPVWSALERALGPRGPLVPTLLPGTTDSRYYRQRGIPAYGISPFAVPSVELLGVHAANEALPREGFLRGVETMRRILEEYALAR